MGDTTRILVFSPADQPITEIAPNDVIEWTRKEKVNGEHSMEITTSVVLKKEMRVLTCDHTGRWHEWVVMGEDADHSSGLTPLGTYYCVWSVQHDLALTTVDKMPGTQTPVRAAVALDAALSGTKRWTVGTVTRTTSGGASMWYKSGWDALGIVVDVWGGEIGVTITVANDGIITARKVDLYDKMGQQSAKRRFEWGKDLIGIRRKVDEAPMAVRIIPRGKGEETENGGHGRKITIESVNGGVEWLQNNETAPLYRLPDGSGGWEYPTVVAENGNIENPQELKDWGLSVLEDYTTPKVTYESNVMQLAQAGMDVTGVALGDAVQCVDRGFSEGGLRVEGRVMQMVINELDETDVQLTIGHAEDGIAGRLASVSQLTATVRAMNGGTLSTADYLNALLERLNSEINAEGGYTYITEGQGLRTYDKAVSDPLVGEEADKVVEVKGGTIRIADSRTAQGEWDWRTVFTSGHIAAEMVTAAHLTAGYIGSPSGNFWNLDTGELQMANTAEFIDQHGDPISVYNIIDMAQSGADAAGDAAEAKATANAAKASADSASAEAKRNVGGTNLLIDSDHTALTKRAANADRYFCTNAGSNVTNTIAKLNLNTRPTGGVTTCFRASFKANQSNNGKWAGIGYYKGKTVPLLDGQKYTFSCWARKTSGTASVQFVYGQTSWVGSSHLALTNGWRRYSFTFTHTQSRVGGTGGAKIEFKGISKSTAACTVEICGMKLELGERATDWSAAPEDTNFGIANSEALSKKYTNEISKKDRDYTNSQRTALDNSFNQSKVFNRLTNNGRMQGLYMKNGQLYVNGTYVRTGTLDAGIIKAGILRDKQARSEWNMTTGYFKTKNAVMQNANVTGQFSSGSTYKMEMKNGQLAGYRNGTRVGYIDYTADVRDTSTGRHNYGLNMVAGTIRFITPRLSVHPSNNTGNISSVCYTGTIKLENVVYNLRSESNGRMRWNYGNVEMRFANGLLTYFSGPSGLVKRSAWKG